MNKRKIIVFSAIALFVWACASDSEIKETAPPQPEETVEMNHAEVGANVVQLVSLDLKVALKAAMKQKSPVEAIGVCNESALPLTSGLNDSLNVTVRRTSLKHRNPINKPTSEEAEVLNGYEADLAAGRSLEPQVVSNKEGTFYYSPIKMGAFCLTCHGSTEQISPEITEELNRLYPEDLATGYEEGQVRGMWTVKFN